MPYRDGCLIGSHPLAGEGISLFGLEWRYDGIKGGTSRRSRVVAVSILFLALTAYQ
jgi:hypothetical protein